MNCSACGTSVRKTTIADVWVSGRLVRSRVCMRCKARGIAIVIPVSQVAMSARVSARAIVAAAKAHAGKTIKGGNADGYAAGLMSAARFLETGDPSALETP